MKVMLEFVDYLRLGESFGTTEKGDEDAASRLGVSERRGQYRVDQRDRSAVVQL
jgi:hypothetical protein